LAQIYAGLVADDIDCCGSRCENDPRFSSHRLGHSSGARPQSEAIIRKVSEELRKVVGQPELDKQLAALGSYTNPMSPTETTAFVHRQQQMWQPVLDEIAKKSQ
jgi:hypothetical protein